MRLKYEIMKSQKVLEQTMDNYLCNPRAEKQFSSISIRRKYTKESVTRVQYLKMCNFQGWRNGSANKGTDFLSRGPRFTS